jgi:hypothetical protein
MGRKSYFSPSIRHLIFNYSDIISAKSLIFSNGEPFDESAFELNIG